MLVQYTGRPSLYLPGAIVIWGAISLATGFVKTFQHALIARECYRSHFVVRKLRLITFSRSAFFLFFFFRKPSFPRFSPSPRRFGRPGFFLGIVEAAFFPGAILVLSNWYRKSELGLRITILYCGSLVSNAFGPLIAYVSLVLIIKRELYAEELTRLPSPLAGYSRDDGGQEKYAGVALALHHRRCSHCLCRPCRHIQ